PLRQAHEPSLSCGASSADETYRFTWLRTFHAPVIVRVSRSGDRRELTAVVLSGAGGYEPGTVERKMERPLQPAEWRRLTAALALSGFWKLPLRDPQSSGADGARWLVEGRRGDEYHLVDRWSPDRGRYRALGLTLLAL